MTTDSPLQEITGVGPQLDKLFAQIGLHTAGDLIFNVPRRYNDFSQVSAIKTLRPGPVTIQAVIKQSGGRYVRRGMHITEAIASDQTDSVRLVWFNQPYRAAAIRPDLPYYISGQYELSHSRFAIMNPSMELVSDFPISTARIVPIYKERKGLDSHRIRRTLRQVVPLIRTLPETLPEWLLQQERLISHAQALESMHFPSTQESLEAAKKRLGFEEIFALSLASLLNKYELLQDTSLSIPFDEALARRFVEHLPFRLTDAQRKVIWRIYQDMQQTQPMNRLVEGDVGSGKTVVAAMAAVMAMAEGYQVAFMAPTELLAQQHADTIYRLLEPLGMEASVGLLVGSTTGTQKVAIHERIAQGKVRLIVGTHALIQEKVDMHKLGLIIIDEQHRFGVEQRKKLMTKAGHMPHVLSLTATPIPRSLALTLYGELDISIIDTKPAGRQPIITEIASPNSRAQLYKKLNQELQAGRQIFVVCPLITASDPAKKYAVENIYEQLSAHDFKDRRVGLLHGKMKAADKQRVMEQFVRHELDILVSTTVIEVGVDVPNASVMLLEAAERFGLAQIHQLRGRVGRGAHQGYCYLMMSDSSAPPRRLTALQQSNDGFKLAELDLQLRGPGAIYGTFQHGQLDLQIATLTDTKLIAAARAAAERYVKKGENLLQYPGMYEQVARLRAVTNLN